MAVKEMILSDGRVVGHLIPGDRYTRLKFNPKNSLHVGLNTYANCSAFMDEAEAAGATKVFMLNDLGGFYAVRMDKMRHLGFEMPNWARGDLEPQWALEVKYWDVYNAKRELVTKGEDGDFVAAEPQETTA